MQHSYTTTLRTKRDLLSTQARTRQLCRMLAFSPLEQARVVCLLGELLWERLSRSRSSTLVLQIVQGRLQVLCQSGDAPARLGLSLALPKGALAAEDAIWALERLQHLSKPDLFAEIRQQNNDLLRAFSEMQMSNSPARPKSVRASAA